MAGITNISNILTSVDINFIAVAIAAVVGVVSVVVVVSVGSSSSTFKSWDDFSRLLEFVLTIHKIVYIVYTLAVEE